MTIAAIYDLHGNLPALNAVLEDIASLNVDRIVIGGDVAYGPLVRDTLDRLLDLGDRCLWIRGNADRELVDCFDGVASEASPSDDTKRAGIWEAERITRVHRDFLAALPTRRILSVSSMGDVLFCHGSPRSDEEIITAATSDIRLRRLLSGVTQEIIVCGHTHAQFDRKIDDKRVVNAGSIGMPYDKPGAYWLLLGSTIELRRTLYDRKHAAAAFRAGGHPSAETFIRNLDHPTSAAEATEVFENTALQREDNRYD